MTDKPNLADARRLADAATDAPWFRRYVDEARTLVPAMEQALRDVLAMHVPLNDLGSPPCAHCLGDEDGESAFVPWPCPTVRAITAHLDIEEQR